MKIEFHRLTKLFGVSSALRGGREKRNAVTPHAPQLPPAIPAWSGTTGQSPVPGTAGGAVPKGML